MTITGVEVYVRTAAFVLVLGLLWARERLSPAFPAPERQRSRIGANVALAVLGVVASRLVAPASVAGVALLAAELELGVFNVLGVPPLLAGLVSIVALDCAVYWQHRLLHRVRWLWRLHAVHHADPHIDVTTAVRFHPVEILLSLLLKSAVVVALGAPVWATIAFESVLAAASLFNHANTRFAAPIERALRRVVVTPELHRVHHATAPACQDRNFGFSVTAWDRLFGTYLAPEQVGAPLDRFGLPTVAANAARSLASMLTLYWRLRV